MSSRRWTCHQPLPPLLLLALLWVSASRLRHLWFGWSAVLICNGELFEWRPVKIPLGQNPPQETRTRPSVTERGPAVGITVWMLLCRRQMCTLGPMPAKGESAKASDPSGLKVGTAPPRKPVDHTDGWRGRVNPEGQGRSHRVEIS